VELLFTAQIIANKRTSNTHEWDEKQRFNVQPHSQYCTVEYCITQEKPVLKPNNKRANLQRYQKHGGRAST